jgi:selenocysteine-specific elongation factor
MTETAPSRPTTVVCTAGHIDHGKTSLVRCLTGIDLDTLPEEKDRGITIALGFTALDLPDGRRVAVVDVPGHEALVRTMIAGAHGVDAAILVVSAMDGVMPQTREHLAVLDLLGIDHGLVVLSKVDLVDEELLELAMADVEDLVDGTFLAGRPMIPVSSETGQGRDALLATLATLPLRARPAQGPFRLPVDRTFVRDGFGTVVTGTSQSGRLQEGDNVRLLPSGRVARIRGIEVHGAAATEVGSGTRVALNLAGIEQEDVMRGVVVAKGGVPCPLILDTSYRHTSEDVDFEDGMPVRFLLGTTERIGRAYLTSDAGGLTKGDTSYLQVRLDGPMPCLPGDAFVLRRVSPVDTLGGGRVLDPWAPKMRRKDREQCTEELMRLEAGDKTVWLDRAGELGLDPEDWARRAPGIEVPLLGDRVVSKRVLARLKGVLINALAEFHADAPLSLGAHRRELRRGRLGHLPERLFDGLLELMNDLGTVDVHGPLVRASAFRIQLTDEQSTLQERIATTVDAAGLAGTTIRTLHETYDSPETDALSKLLVADGRLALVPQVGLVGQGPLDTLRARLLEHFDQHESMSPVDFKELSGLTRKTAIPLLEWLDRSGWTKRTLDTRVRGATLSQA